MGADKVTTLADAIRTHVHSGDTVALEGFGHLVPTAAAHEIIRQGFTELTVARMSCDAMIDQLLVAGCVTKLVSSFVGNSSAGSLHEVRRRVEHQDPVGLDIEEYSHGGMIARYQAGAAGLPFFPTPSYAGSDLVTLNPQIRHVIDPYSGETINVVPPLNPDVAVIHAQRADRSGNVQAWGILGVQREVAFSARRVIVTVEEVVADEVVRADPNRTIVPAQIVDAVVACPFGAHPTSVQDYYERDDEFQRAWSERGRSHEALREWVARHILGTRDNAELGELYGPAFWQQLAERRRAPLGGRR